MRTFTRCALGAAAVSALCLVGTTARAQVDTGTILGTVKDASGAVVAGANVTITHEGQAFTLSRVTRPDGTYIFTPIRIGTYRVEVESPGFRKAVRRGIELNLQQQAVVDINLETGQLTATWSWTYRSSARTTRVAYTTEVKVRGLLRVTGGLVQGQIERDVRRNLQALKRFVEGQ